MGLNLKLSPLYHTKFSLQLLIIPISTHLTQCSISTPPGTSENQIFFRRFQRVQKWNIGLKWVKWPSFKTKLFTNQKTYSKMYSSSGADTHHDVTISKLIEWFKTYKIEYLKNGA